MLAQKIAYKSDDLYTKLEMIHSLQSALYISIYIGITDEEISNMYNSIDLGFGFM